MFRGRVTRRCTHYGVLQNMTLQVKHGVPGTAEQETECLKQFNALPGVQIRFSNFVCNSWFSWQDAFIV